VIQLTGSKIFDTRLAAALALKSFVTATTLDRASSQAMSVVLVLYDFLIDDDDEVREIAAQAASPIIGADTTPLLAIDSLLQWMAERFAESPAFRLQAIYRMVGQVAPVAETSGEELCLMPAAERLTAALEVDDALFAVEKQNLFVDEVLESQRWATVLEGLCSRRIDNDGEYREALHGWCVSGLENLAALAERDDGPLGWASQPRVFAVAAVILRSSVTASRWGPELGELRSRLAELRRVGERCRLHGELLLIAEVDGMQENAGDA
jgi:hypothetical protein